MTKIVYEVVEHDGGWAYKAEGTFSETYRSHEAASAAAEHAAAHQRLSGSEEAIDFEDAGGHWHAELAKGDDRPETEVDDRG